MGASWGGTYAASVGGSAADASWQPAAFPLFQVVSFLIFLCFALYSMPSPLPPYSVKDRSCVLALQTLQIPAKSPRHCAAEGPKRRGYLLSLSQKLDLGASASVAKSLFHWLKGRFMMLKRMLWIQFL